MKWGFTGEEVLIADLTSNVGRGWTPLVTRLVYDLLALGWNGTVYQVKEKFGGLRFYIGTGSAAISARIDAAEEESFKTCEDCGEPGTLHTERNWLRTLCSACAEAPCS